MARTPRKEEIAMSIWENSKAICPICGSLITNWYCPYCGIPKNNSSYYVLDNIAFRCGNSHFIRESTTLDNYKLCSKCYTPNPYNANYCRNCGENIITHARDENGHEWIDLGLSVLWSIKTLQGRFLWNDKNQLYDVGDIHNVELRTEYRKNLGESGKDAATYCWGEKWRTPTMKEFKELITKCTWEKHIISTTNQYALKAIGPNGNSIIVPMEPNCINWLWSSTQENKLLAYAFSFYEKFDFKSTLTAKQKKEIEFRTSNDIRFKVELPTFDFLSSLRYNTLEDYLNCREEKRRKTFPQYEKTIEKQRKTLYAMGDDSQEREYNKKEDLKRWHKLWLLSPIKIHINENIDQDGITLKPIRKTIGANILPVLDRK